MIITTYQPIVSTDTNKWFGAQVLPLTQDKFGFLVRLEDSANLVDWGRVDLEVAQQLKKDIHLAEINFESLLLTVSDDTLKCNDRFERWLWMIKHIRNVTPSYLILEISPFVHDWVLKARWPALRDTGLLMCMGTFGRGSSTTSRLSEYAWDACKFRADQVLLDESLLNEEPNRPWEIATTWCHNHHATVVLEEVTSRQLAARGLLDRYLLQTGGYHGEPMPLSHWIKPPQAKNNARRKAC